MSDSANLHELHHQLKAQEQQIAGLSASDDFTQNKDAPVFERLGVIVRSLHDTLHEIGADKVLSEAASEFPSARERLLHIARWWGMRADSAWNYICQCAGVPNMIES